MPHGESTAGQDAHDNLHAPSVFGQLGRVPVASSATIRHHAMTTHGKHRHPGPVQDGDSDMDVAPAIKKRKKRKVHTRSFD